MSLVLGINGYHVPATDYESEWRTKWYHDAACVLVEDGVVRFAVEEERLTRNKHTGVFPSAAVARCLVYAGITLADVDAIAVGEEGGDGPFRDPLLSAQRIANAFRAAGLVSEDLREVIRLVAHHRAHAASAYIPSGFDEALVFTMDGFGDGVAGLVMTAQDDVLTTRPELGVEQSLGNFFAAVLPYFAYHHFDEYKVMGLASYGDRARFAPLVSELYTLLPGGDFAPRVRDQQELARTLSLAGPPRSPQGVFLQHHKDLAAAYQHAFERIVMHVLEHEAQATGLRRLCMAGGCAQNSTFNGRLASSGLFDEIFVQPASNDAGTALGAALVVSEELRKERKEARLTRARVSTSCLGPDVEPDPVLEALLTRWEPFVDWSRCDVVDAAAELIDAGHVVGWVQGRSEFGPRALGSRSILADPRRADSKTRINAVIKEREVYRPFAPAVIAEEATRYFQLSGTEASSPFMTFAVPVVESKRAVLPAVTHVDGTARVQVVHEESHPRFGALLRAFGDRTGVPVLLNTSFNSRREPIVQSAQDAVTCLLTSQLEYLFVGDYQVRKRPFDRAALFGLVPSIPSHVCLSFRTGRDGHPTYNLMTRGDKATRVSAELGRWLFERMGAGTEGGASEAGSVADKEAGEELYRLWVERLVMLTPRRR